MKLKWNFLLIQIVNLFFWTSISFGQVVEKTVTVENSDTTGQVSLSQLTDEATRKLAEELVVDFVGAETFSRSKNQLMTKVIQNAGKFVPFQKASEPERGPFGVRLTVQYKVSLTDFRKLLADSGLFSKTRLAQHVISFLTFEDESGNRVVTSWRPARGVEEARVLSEWNEEFKKVFEKAGYSFNKNLNPAWIETFGENTSAQDILNKNSLASSFVLWGTARYTTQKNSNEKILIVQSKFYSQDYKKEVTDSARRFSTRDDGHRRFESWAQDLVSQLDEIDSKSLLQQSLLKLTVVGSIPLTEQDQFKQVIANSTSLIKSISERRFEANQIVYEIETDATADALQTKLKTLDWKGRKLKLEFRDQEITMEIL